MFNLPTILGCFALLLLFGGIVSSAKLICGPAAQRLDGSLVANPPAELSAILLLGSLVLSLVAAGLAVTSQFFS
jgi:hypothetical protein